MRLYVIDVMHAPLINRLGLLPLPKQESVILSAQHLPGMYDSEFFGYLWSDFLNRTSGRMDTRSLEYKHLQIDGAIEEVEPQEDFIYGPRTARRHMAQFAYVTAHLVKSGGDEFVGGHSYLATDTFDQRNAPGMLAVKLAHFVRISVVDGKYRAYGLGSSQIYRFICPMSQFAASIINEVCYHFRCRQHGKAQSMDKAS